MRSQQLQNEMVKTIVASLEEGLAKSKNNLKWECPWHGLITPPKNGYTNDYYSGGNSMWLSMVQRSLNYSTNEWATAKQWNQINGYIIKGSSAGLQYCLKPIIVPDEDDKTQTVLKGFRAYPVFNRDQVKGLPEQVPPIENKFNRDDRIENFMNQTGITTRHSKEARAYYNPRSDYVHSPFKKTYKTTNGYYSTIFHEYIHATGHKDRLKRVGIAREGFNSSLNYFSEDIYAKEELIAELGASFLSSHFGIYNERRQDHTSYLASWIKNIKADPKLLWTVSSDAQRASDYLLNQFHEEESDEDLHTARVA